MVASSISDHNFQQLWLKVQLKTCKSFLLGTVYRPPNTPISFLENLTETFMDLSLLSPGLDMILLGDLNCNLLGNSPDGQALIDLCSTLNLFQVVEKHTRVTETSQTLIDVILTTNKLFIDTCDVMSSTISDHSLVYLTLKLKAQRTRTSYITTRSYKNFDPDKLIEDRSHVPIHMGSFFEDLDDQVDTFNNLFLDVLNEHAPIKRVKVKSKPNPFITPEIRQLMKTRDNCYKCARKIKDHLLWNAYKFFRQEVKREIRLAEKVHVRSELQNSNGNSNSIWKTINHCLPKKKTSQKSTEDQATLANKFNEFYTSVGKATADKTKLLAQEHNFNHCSSSQTTNSSQHVHEDSGQAAFNFQLVTEAEVEKIIKSLPSTKAPGIDKVSAKILKYSLPATLPILTSIFNNSFAACTFPRDWKISEVAPILKSGDFDNPSNTPPISLLPILSKV